ncbi:MAG: T9SS type A sorting domain-containing protein [Muribaculaceae bacterium]|nr:T9SS type A sorting domain-containing protein [Muribaculaceae bacterium]
MRKFFLALLTTLGTICAIAADLKDPIIITPPYNTDDEVYFNMIPASSNDENSGFYIQEYNWDSPTQSFTIYDDNINVVKELTVNLVPRTIQEYSQERDIVSLFYLGFNRTGSMNLLPYEGKDIYKMAEEYKKRYGEQVQVTTLPTGEQIIAITYIMYDKFDKKYPWEFFILSDNPAFDSYWEKCEANYEPVMGFDPNGEIKESTRISYPTTPNVVIVAETGGDDGWYQITKGIFASDYAYILPIPEEVPFQSGGGEEDHFKYWGTETKAKGFQIYDTNHSLLQTISFPTGYYQSIEYYGGKIDYVTLSGKKYLFIKVENEDASQESVLIYRLDGTTKITHVLTAPVGKISPRSPKKGDTVTVGIDEQFSNESCLVTVCSTDGRNVIQKIINPGENSVSFSTAKFHQGVYVVNVTGKKGKIETAKIIVR